MGISGAAASCADRIGPQQLEAYDGREQVPEIDQNPLGGKVIRTRGNFLKQEASQKLHKNKNSRTTEGQTDEQFAGTESGGEMRTGKVQDNQGKSEPKQRIPERAISFQEGIHGRYSVKKRRRYGDARKKKSRKAVVSSTYHGSIPSDVLLSSAAGFSSCTALDGIPCGGSGSFSDSGWDSEPTSGVFGISCPLFFMLSRFSSGFSVACSGTGPGICSGVGMVDGSGAGVSVGPDVGSVVAGV